MSFLLLRESETMERLLRDVTREVEDWGEEESDEERPRHESELVDQEWRREPIGLDVGSGQEP